MYIYIYIYFLYKNSYWNKKNSLKLLIYIRHSDTNKTITSKQMWSNN